MKSDKKVITLWLDETSSDAPAWIVSRDEGDSTETLVSYEQNEYQAARAHAITIGRDENLPVIEMDKHGATKPIS